MARAQEIADELLALARRLNDPDLALQAHQALGLTALCRGNPSASLRHVEQAAALYDPKRQALLERFRHIILMLDGDPPGRKASIVIAQQLRPHCHVRVVLLPDGVQPDQLPADYRPFRTAMFLTDAIC